MFGCLFFNRITSTELACEAKNKAAGDLGVVMNYY